jgi:uncharacterized C2H2 Zn-finger protein
MARARNQTKSEGELKCPECGRTFARAAALGAHRRQAHGVVGASSQSRSSGRRSARTAASSSAGRASRGTGATTRRSRSTSTAAASSDGRGRSGRAADRDALLKAIFPDGIPPKEDVIRAANAWLDDAERLARMR